MAPSKPEATGRAAPIDPATTTIDNECYDSFGDGWWAADGPAAGLHEINPVRLAYFDRVFAAQLGPSIRETGTFIDVGCGGGILTEALARAGYRITGFDVSEPSLAAAERHATATGVAVTYRAGSAYQLDLPTASVDGIVISDVLEHLHDLGRAVAELARVLRPGGVLAFDTINRTIKSYVLMIVAAQDVLGVIPRRTHDWRMFIKPGELGALFAASGLQLSDVRGMTPARRGPSLVWSVLRDRRFGAFELSDDLSMSYIGFAVRGSP